MVFVRLSIPLSARESLAIKLAHSIFCVFTLLLILLRAFLLPNKMRETDMKSPKEKLPKICQDYRDKKTTRQVLKYQMIIAQWKAA